MKKLSVLAIAFVAIAFAACGGKKTEAAAEADTLKSFEQQQIEASIKMHFDSIASEMARLPQLPFVQEGNGGLTLSKEEKQVKPDFLIDPATATEAATLSEKYRMLSALSVDKKIASLYEMPVEEYDKAIAKLTADINDPSFKAIQDGGTLYETSTELYDAMEKNGRINYFWQLAATSLVEEMYVLTQNTDKFITAFDDESASNITYRTTLLVDAVDRLAVYDPEIEPVAEAMKPLGDLNAISVEQLKTQLAEMKEDVIKARAALVK